MLEQGSKVASEEHIHVHPYAAIPPDHQQSDQVPVKPRFLILADEQRTIFERRTLGEFTCVRDAKLKRARIARDVTREQRVAGEVTVGPHDEARMRVLRRKERFERVFLSLAELRQVGAPIRVIVRAGPVWRERRGLHGAADGAGKVVAVET